MICKNVLHFKTFLLSLLIISVVLISGCTNSDSGLEGKIGDLLESGTDKMTKQEIAVATGNTEVCKEATHPDVCLLAVAKSELDITICGEIKEPAYRQECLNYVKLENENIDTSKCGAYFQPCCPDDTCNFGLECGSNSRCRVVCGEFSYPCCENMWCNPSKGVVCSVGKCVTCGGRGQPCCQDKVCNRKDDKCDITTDTCEISCGQNGYPCCEGNWCDPDVKDLVCHKNLCQFCGGPYQPCCPGNECNEGSTCNANGVCE